MSDAALSLEKPGESLSKHKIGDRRWRNEYGKGCAILS
jgi:hypothetical protein